MNFDSVLKLANELSERLGFGALPELPIIPAVISAVVAGLVGVFLIFFVPLAGRVYWKLRIASGRLSHLYARNGSSPPKREVEACFGKRGVLAHLWSEYQDTLHDQYEDVQGERRLVRTRATVPAEALFTTHTLVDNQVFVEFFKHLPGILTGIGIIGTFLELIVGLQGFAATLKTGAGNSIDTATLNQGLAALLDAVKGAFIASGGAISAAIAVTILEKLLLTGCYRRVGKLNQVIDALYSAGAGEEYLAQLVRSADESATQTKQLKDGLVSDLRVMLTELTDRQVAAQHQSAEIIATRVSDTLQKSLEAPLGKIAGAVQQASGEQGTAVQSMLADLMTAFMAKLDDTIGAQIKGLVELTTESAGAMRQMQVGLQKLADDIAAAGTKASEGMNAQLTTMMMDAEQRQKQMAELMQKAVDEMRLSIAGGQSELQAQVANSIDGLRGAVGEIVSNLAAQREEMMSSNASDMSRQREAVEELLSHIRKSGSDAADQYRVQLAATMDAMEGKLSGLLSQSSEQQEAAQARMQSAFSEIDAASQKLVSAVENCSSAMRDTVQKLSSVTTNAIDGINRGAETMRQSAEGFASAGNVVNGALEKGAALFDKTAAASTQLDLAATTVRDAVAGYNQTRGSLETMTETFRQIMQEAKERADMSREMVSQLDQVARSFNDASAQAKDYLADVERVLGDGFDEFADAVTGNMKKVRSEFDSQMNQAVNLLANEVQELGTVLDGLKTKLERV